MNFDIQGANLLPSLRNTTFAVAAETGGARFQEIVRNAADDQTLDTSMLSSIFGQYRSDYASFIAPGAERLLHRRERPVLPHGQDEIGIVDFDKLESRSPCRWP